MIFYFSGTGNSLYAAKSIAEHNNEGLVSIASAINSGDGQCEYGLKDNEMVGFVYPVYAWGPPKMVLEFIRKLKLNNYKNNYTFSVATCGENIGNTMKIVNKYLSEKGMKLDSGFSVKMPNNYIIMGNIDSKEIEHKKLIEAEDVLININNTIKPRKTGVFNLKKGALPVLLTGLINPLFNKNMNNTKPFFANTNCNSCGICEKVCNCNNIKLNDRPQWGSRCTQCLACIHYCPTKAIQYGKGTEKKGRYTNPNVSINEISK